MKKVLALLSLNLLSACIIIPASEYPSLQNDEVIVQNLNTNYRLKARLYPSNQTAQHYGVLTANINIISSHHGVFTLVAGNETFKGEATTKQNSGQGLANASSSSGQFINCNYDMNNREMGSGKCEMSNGAQFNIHINK